MAEKETLKAAVAAAAAAIFQPLSDGPARWFCLTLKKEAQLEPYSLTAYLGINLSRCVFCYYVSFTAYFTRTPIF